MHLNNDPSRRLFNFLITGLTFSLLISCRYFSLQDQKITYSDDKYYYFNSNSILKEIKEGKKNIFTSQNITPPPPFSQAFSAVQWEEEDFISVAIALSEATWDTAIDTWQLRHASWSLRCEDITFGPQFSLLVFFKEESNTQSTSLVEREVYIDPSNNSVHWSETKYIPNSIYPEPILLDKFALSLKDALQIAEQNGGARIRKNTNNNCSIRVELFNSDDHWRVSYVEVLDLLVIDINAFTGKHKIIVQE